MSHRIECPWCSHPLPVELGKRAMKEHLLKCILIKQGYTQEEIEREGQLTMQLEASPEVSKEDE